MRNAEEAYKLALSACQTTGYKSAEALDALAAALAGRGMFPQAVVAAEKALKLAESAANATLAGEVRARIKLYRAGKPFRHAGAKALPPTTQP